MAVLVEVWTTGHVCIRPGVDPGAITLGSSRGRHWPVGWIVEIPTVTQGRCTGHPVLEPPAVLAPGSGVGTAVPRR